MKRGAIVSGVVAILATVGLATVFVRNASPYATIKDAASLRGDGVHVVGQMVPKTLQQNPLKRQLSFRLKDETGEMPVIYNGPPMANLQAANQVVVIGQMEEGTFMARKMLVKCPSKYESEKTSAAAKEPYGNAGS